MNSIHIQYYNSPCGEIVLASMGNELCLCDWNEMPCAERNKHRLVKYMNAVFVGTEFQQQVWNALLEIPYGETRSYKDIALSIANLKGIRAVAQAIGANGISILIPCHRVIGSNHSLTGFAGGIEAKRILLEIEREMSNIKTL